MSLFTDSILISTPYLPCKQLVVTSNTGPILVFPRIQPFASDDFSSLGKENSRHVTGSANCKNSSMCFVMKYCPTSTVFKNPASVQIFYQSIWLWKPFHSFLVLLQKIFLRRNLNRRSGCHYQQVCWREQWVRLLCQYGSPRTCLTRTVFLTHI